jgi:uncharacterized protein (DUF697 family)
MLGGIMTKTVFKQFVVSTFIFAIGLTIHTMFVQNQMMKNHIVNQEVQQQMIKSTFDSSTVAKAE